VTPLSQELSPARATEVRRAAKAAVSKGKTMAVATSSVRPEERADFTSFYKQYDQGELPLENAPDRFLPSGLERSLERSHDLWATESYRRLQHAYGEEKLRRSWKRNLQEGRDIDPLTGALPSGELPETYTVRVNGAIRTWRTVAGCTAVGCTEMFGDGVALVRHWARHHARSIKMVKCMLCEEVVAGLDFYVHLKEDHRLTPDIARRRCEATTHYESQRNSSRKHEGDGPHHPYTHSNGWNLPWMCRDAMLELAKKAKKAAFPDRATVVQVPEPQPIAPTIEESTTPAPKLSLAATAPEAQPSSTHATATTAGAPESIQRAMRYVSAAFKELSTVQCNTSEVDTLKKVIAERDNQVAELQEQVKRQEEELKELRAEMEKQKAAGSSAGPELGLGLGLDLTAEDLAVLEAFPSCISPQHSSISFN